MPLTGKITPMGPISALGVQSGVMTMANGNSYHNIEPGKRAKGLAVNYRAWAADGTLYAIYRTQYNAGMRYRAAMPIADGKHTPYFYAATLREISARLE